MNDYFQLILMIICTPFALVWICLAITKGKKYATYTKSTFAREFQMSKLFCVGFALMPILHMGTKTRRAKLKIKEIAEIKGKKYAEYYYYILQGAKITYAYTVFLVFMLLSVLAGSVEAALLGVIFSVLVVIAGQTDSQKAGDPDGSSTGVVQAYASGQFGNGSPRCMEKNSDYRRACII